MAAIDRVDSVVVKPIIFGNRAYRLPQKLSNGHTHRWTVYVRPFNNEKLSNYVRKVQFKLHQDYENPNRMIEQEPFEVSETGWGEFHVHIKLYFIDPMERQASCTYFLALHQPEFTNNKGETYVLKEVYDELVFINPRQKVYEAITAKPVKNKDHVPWEFQDNAEEDENYTKAIANQSEEEVATLIDAIRKMSGKITELKKKYKIEDDDADNTMDENMDNESET